MLGGPHHIKPLHAVAALHDSHMAVNRINGKEVSHGKCRHRHSKQSKRLHPLTLPKHWHQRHSGTKHHEIHIGCAHQSHNQHGHGKCQPVTPAKFVATAHFREHIACHAHAKIHRRLFLQPYALRQEIKQRPTQCHRHPHHSCRLRLNLALQHVACGKCKKQYGHKRKCAVHGNGPQHTLAKQLQQQSRQ